MTPFVTVIVPTFRPDLGRLGGTLKALDALEYPRERFEILVIDNSPMLESGLQAFVEAHSDRVIFERSLHGAHEARNLGLEIARGEWCLFVDDDIIVSPETLTALLAATRLPKVAGVGGRVLPAWPSVVPEWVQLYYDREFVEERYLQTLGEAGCLDAIESRLNLGLLSLLDLGDEVREVDENWLYSCHLLVSRSVALRAGGFGPDLFGARLLGDNEVGLLRRVAALGYRLMYTPQSSVHHVISPSRLQLRYFLGRVRNDGYCDAYVSLRESPLSSRAKLLSTALRDLARALACFGTAFVQLLRRRRVWRRRATDCAFFSGRATYYLAYLLSKRRRALVHRESYLRGTR